MDIRQSGMELRSIEQAADRLGRQAPQRTESGEEKTSFRDVLDQVRFSKHAAQRLSQRGIDLSRGQMQRLSQGTSQARSKGIREGLVLVDELAFIVNIPNSTVVTAVDTGAGEDAVFTNIDGTVIV